MKSGRVKYGEVADMKFDYKEKLFRLVNEEIILAGVSNRLVLSAILEVPRHEFVLPEYREEAYYDHPLPVGYGQTISQPSLVAIMTQFLELKGNEKVLEIGTGSGYQAAILSRIVRVVYTMEIIEELAKKAKNTLERLNYKNIEVFVGNGNEGLAEYAPFEAIMVTAGAKKIPENLILQLKERGRMVIPVGENQYRQELLVGKKIRGQMKWENFGEVRFVPFKEK